MPALLKHTRFSFKYHPNQVCVRLEVCFILCSYESVKVDIMRSTNPQRGRRRADSTSPNRKQEAVT